MAYQLGKNEYESYKQQSSNPASAALAKTIGTVRTKEILEHSLFLLNTAGYYRIPVVPENQSELSEFLKELNAILPETEEVSDEI